MATYLTTAQVAEKWACDRSTVTARARSGALVGMRLGTDWRFSLAAVEAYERRHATDASPAEEPKSRTAAPREEVRAPVSVEGFTLPDGYEPCFPELWGQEAPTKKAALPR